MSGPWLVTEGEMMLAGRPPGGAPGDPRYVPCLVALELDDTFMAAYRAACAEGDHQ